MSERVPLSQISDIAALRRLALLAGTVALEAPERQGSYSVSATIPWSTVNKIRDELERMGMDWRTAHRKLRADWKAKP